jgi:hypothetical protein
MAMFPVRHLRRVSFPPAVESHAAADLAGLAPPGAAWQAGHHVRGPHLRPGGTALLDLPDRLAFLGLEHVFGPA